ncbi:V-type proton ATPase subunit E [Hanseniaspora valbyensis NRRL Y-1626]|uniref:V-type proton ATPase subunit E n=1 Tax=Hanseniaspora valbyensis NRRL Y-1626 TaxID=766949 RepID=A0A1B7TK09_9ASCO|nr:V-type proton ATPase subunit E [Hanseniaspora valbyensis NRRL Y-1626]
MSSFYTVVQIFLIVSMVNIAAWLYAPRNQALRAKKSITVFRSTFILTTSMMFLMWAITYLSQLHPLVEPRRSDLRVEQKI